MPHNKKTFPMENEQELAAEQAAVKEVKEDEVRASIITEYGFDEVDDAERIDKLTKKEMENHKKLSSAIGQKIKHRTEAEALKNDPRLKAAVTPPAESKIAPEDIDKKLDERLAQRDLDEMDTSDEIRKEIGDWAKFKGITVKQAARAPHIVLKMDEYEKEQKAEAATISRTNRASGSKKTYTFDSPPNVDMSTKEGREEWQSFLDAMKKAGH